MVVWSLIKKKNHPTQIPNKPMLFCLVSLLHCPGIAIIPDPRNTWSLSKQGPLFSDQKGNGITTVPPASDPPQQAGRERARHSRAHAKAARKRTAADARPRRCPPTGHFPMPADARRIPGHREAAAGTRFRGHWERARCAAAPCVRGHRERAVIGKGPLGRVAAGMCIRGHRERALKAGGGDARPRASGKGPGAGGGGRVGIRKGPRGREAAGTRASGKGQGGGGVPRRSAGIGKGPGGGRRRGRAFAGIGKGPRGRAAAGIAKSACKPNQMKW
jgi:hypothetical protein